ncbi:uncharacterized protein B0P05DRAFT_556021 [Gilbertella persicaria]|uniref:uncharacterized protein n=1 Tax=Gilbertella persicaria TaxID=101096 RepID=UPI00222051C2|nr:uncharacterized protein B0P05DRAFT_556021 [Gilbertella persicaria]KAI8062780.1 hypothetical protein B0P05DRAFT_556021 [Gilbertella persicaria]
MGLPLWRPRDLKEDIEPIIHKPHHATLNDDNDIRVNIPHQLMHNIHNGYRRSRPSFSSSPSSSSSSSPSPSSFSSSSSSSSQRSGSRLFQPLVTRSRLERRRQMLERLRAQHSSSTSPPIRSELDRRLQQRISEKEDLLEQLTATVNLLDQFLSARTALGSDFAELFITQDLPAVLESASSLAALVPAAIGNNSTTLSSENTENNTLQEMVNRLLQIPPYSARIQNVELNIISTHRRIQEQLDQLSSTVSLSSPHQQSTGTINMMRTLAGGNQTPSHSSN